MPVRPAKKKWKQKKIIENQKRKPGQNLRKWRPYPHRRRVLLRLRQPLGDGHRHFVSTPLHRALEYAVPPSPPPAPTTTTPPSAPSTLAVAASPASRCGPLSEPSSIHVALFLGASFTEYIYCTLIIFLHYCSLLHVVKFVTTTNHLLVYQ
jgi:hypothetical protein